MGRASVYVCGSAPTYLPRGYNPRSGPSMTAYPPKHKRELELAVLVRRHANVRGVRLQPACASRMTRSRRGRLHLGHLDAGAMAHTRSHGTSVAIRTRDPSSERVQWSVNTKSTL